MTKRVAVRLPHRRAAPAKIVLSRGQKKRAAKRENEEWKKKVVSATVRAEKVKKHGKALGTMDELLEAISPNKDVPAKKTIKRKPSRSADLAKFDAIVNYADFQANPLVVMREHLLK